MVEASLLLEPDDADRFEKTKRAEGIRIRGVFGFLERNCNMALGREIVDLIGLDLANYPDQAGGVREITVMEAERRIRLVGIKIEMINTVGIEQRGATLDAVDLVPLLQEQFRQVGAVLSCNTRNKCALFSHENPVDIDARS